MDAELIALASSGATTLVGVMVSDAWTQARDRVAQFFSRGEQDSDAAEELVRSRQELMSAIEEGDTQAASDAQAVWRMRLRAVLRSDPHAAAELQALLQELQLLADRYTAAAEVHNTISGGTQHGPVIQGRDISGLTFHSVAPPRSDP